MKEHQARKRFGQNFLVCRGTIARIVEAIAPRREDRVVEIGPGLGALTEPLLERLDHLDVVEIDRDLIARLKDSHPPERLTVHEGDALEFDFGEIGSDLRIVGNLPYNISTPLLFHLATYAASVRDMHFMLQKEVVDRMVADPGTADYGRLSVMLQYRFHMDRLFVVPPGAFNPAPKVDSAIVRLIPKPAAELTVRDEGALAKVVSAAFGQRRKMLRNNLRELFSEAQLRDLGIAPTARAEELTVEDYVRLAGQVFMPRSG
ncbi:MAG: 16S rRNA (adenine(1518)-N(6)/adenine(1519)-N(6))-dimethyltransferase RsmA [Rhodocyclales bacterium]|jgi:16S rRNA (adenine1518-N6/adenine1519-N6)-dimethyltransferase|nr:16S rRNA (adenine(1518)-N(6)/adenine(1519)-N(6))-dimethyltransferase RsmA [Rhodocyclales bacterium]